jgi:uncharacterized protein (DUF169 family)
MKDYAEYAGRLGAILGLERLPVAVKFVSQHEAVPDGFIVMPGLRYCQALMESSRGAKVLLTPDNVTCPASAAALGFKPLPNKLETGEMLVAYGIFADAEAGRNTIHSMPRLPMGQYKAVAACPLGEAPYTPDVVVIESQPERLMWLALASVRRTGGRLNLSTAILQATCVDGTILPFVEQRLNASLGCYGCREATDMTESECILGFPGHKLETLMAELEELATKAMPRVRGKNAYQALARRTQLEGKHAD